jgi:peptide chain release factor 3
LGEQAAELREEMELVAGASHRIRTWTTTWRGEQTPVFFGSRH